MTNTETARQAFENLCAECGTTPADEQTAILSIGSEFLPEFALRVRDGGEPTAEYWEWLFEQTSAAQAEHDSEVAAGYEWAECKP